MTLHPTMSAALAPFAPKDEDAHKRRILTIQTALDDYARGYIDEAAAVARMAAHMDEAEAREWCQRVRASVRGG